MTPSWLFLCLCAILVVYASDFTGVVDMALSDLQKLVENMKRAQSITDRASQDAAKHAVIMDNFEKRLAVNHENMSKIEEYDKLMAQMDTSNGGPPLEETFSAPAESPSGTTSVGTAGGHFHSDGRQL